MATHPAYPCPPCQDSPLSTTGTVVGIITFVYLVIAGALYNLAGNKRELVDVKALILDGDYLLLVYRERAEAWEKHASDAQGEKKSLQNARAECALSGARAAFRDLTRLQERSTRATGWWSSRVQRMRSRGRVRVPEMQVRLVNVGSTWTLWRDEYRDAVERLKIWAPRAEQEVARFEELREKGTLEQVCEGDGRDRYRYVVRDCVFSGANSCREALRVEGGAASV